MKTAINTPRELSELYDTWCHTPPKFPLSIEIKEISGKRSLPQNSISHKVYERIGAHLYGGDSAHAKSECKLHYGIPILRRDDDDFSESYGKLFESLDYNIKLWTMGGSVELGINKLAMKVTSIMSKKQKTDYLEKILNVYSAQGVPFGDFT